MTSEPDTGAGVRPHEKRHGESTMASRPKERVVYAAGMVQGIVLVTFPAASTIFTDPAEYDLSSTQYGTLFLPQVVTAIADRPARRRNSAAASAPSASTSRASPPVCVSMALLLVSSFLTSDQRSRTPLLLLATAFLGAGFGLTVPDFEHLYGRVPPDAPPIARSSCSTRCSGSAPFSRRCSSRSSSGLGFWWGLPVTSAALLVVLLVVSLSATRCACTPVRRRRGAGTERDACSLLGLTPDSRSSTASARP